jgi:general secretion pathway protein B
MSYILDALRKSDQQRQLGMAPTLLTVQTTAAQPKRPAYWIYGALAAVLVGAGVAIGWLHQWQTQQPPPAAEINAMKPLEPTRHQTLPTAQPEPQADPAMQPASPDNNLERKAHALAIAEPHHTPPKTVAAHPKETASTVKKKSPEMGISNGVQEQGAMEMTELPPSIRQEIPKMTVSLHAYARNPKERLVSVNDKLLREGDSLPPGLRLEQITPAGMIFSYKGYRFRSE